jgi:hypothetical protein
MKDKREGFKERKLDMTARLLNRIAPPATIMGLLVLAMPSAVTAQNLNRKIEVERLEESQKINPEADRAYVHVRSEVPNLRFDSNRRIDRQVQTSSGDWDLWLPAGTHLLKIDAEGYQRLELSATTFQGKRSYELVIRASGFGSLARADEDLVEITFELNVDSAASSYGAYAPIVTFGRMITYRLPKGQYDFRFSKQGYSDQSTSIRVDSPRRISVDLARGVSRSSSRLLLPGFLRISSEPSGANVIVDGQLLGATPLQAELTAGTHQLELRKAIHHPDVSTFVVEEGRPVAISRTLKPRFGYYAVTSTVPASTVRLDNKPVGTAPIVRTSIESGRHKLTVEAPLHHAYEVEFEVKDGDERTFRADLRPAYGFVEIRSEPESGAEVYLDGRKMGVTPFTSERLASGAYMLKVAKSLYRDYEDRIVVADSQTVRRTVSLAKDFGTVSVKAEASSISVNGAVVGRGTYTARLAPGRYTFVAERGTKYINAQEEIYLAVGENREIILEPAPRQGGVSVIVSPNAAADASIYVNDQLQGRAPLAFRLLIGDYTLKAEKPGYLDLTQALSVKEGETQSIRLTMMTYEGSRQAVRDRWGTYKWVSGGVAVLAGGAGVYFKLAANDAYKQYKAATITSDAVSLREKTQRNDNLSRIAIGAAIGFAVTTAVTWIVQQSI